MSNAREPEVFFHVGLGKVASSYLQQKVFPKLEDIRYISTHKYKKSPSIIAKGEDAKYLVSREFDRQYEDELRWFSSHYPNANVIILLRRHDSWIASQYRRFVKNGHTMPFSEFFNLDESKSFWAHKHIEYYWKLKLVEECFGSKPLVLFHDELKEDAWSFFDRICAFMGARYSKDNVSLDTTHSSYSVKQLLVIRDFCRKYTKRPPKGYANKFKHWLLYRPYWAFFHLILYAAKVFPSSWVPKEELYSKEELSAIKEAYDEDWQKVVSYAKENNPAFD